MDRFIRAQNVQRYRSLLECATEEAGRERLLSLLKLLSLLAEEDQKQKDAGDFAVAERSSCRISEVNYELLAEYLESALQFQLLAGETKDDPRFKRSLLRQVVAYRMLAVKEPTSFICQDRRSLHSERRAAKIELSHLINIVKSA